MATKNKKQSIRLLNTLLAVVGGLVLSLIFGFAYYTGRLLLTDGQFLWVLVAFWCVCLGFVMVIITGLNLRFHDPSLTMQQMVWASLSSMAAMSVCEGLDGAFYLMTLVTLAFGVLRCTLKAFYGYCGFVVAISLVAIVIRTYLIKSQPEFTGDILHWLAYLFCVMVFGNICRSLIILRSRLKKNNEQLKHALQARSYFLANMSHEIRTPMNGVLGMLDVISRTSLDVKQQRFVHIAQSSANGLLTIINDILDFSKIEAGKMDIEKVMFDLHALLASVTETFQAKADGKQLQLQLQLMDDVPQCVVADPVRVRQVLNNLMANAFKFTEQGSVSLVVACVTSNPFVEDTDTDRDTDKTTESDTSGCLWLQVSVEDTGIGIDRAKLATLFDAFIQADASTTRMYGGTGLGLAISQQLVSLMGGMLSAESTLGKGSCFTFTLPITVAGCALNSSEDELNEQILPFDTELAKACRLLLVDDNEVNRAVGTELLTEMGFEIVCACDGAEAIHLIELSIADDAPFAVIFMDCQMPVLDGYEATRRIRDHEVNAINRQIIIAMTANAMVGDREKCLAAGMDDYLPKPINRQQVYKILERWLPAEQLTARGLSCKQLPPEDSSHNDNFSASSSEPADESSVVPLKVWDQQRLLALVNHKPKRVSRLITGYLKNLAPSITTIDNLLVENDHTAATVEIHGLKGASANLGADKLAALLAQAEVELKAGELDNSQRWLTVLYEDAGLVKQSMIAFLHDIDPEAAASLAD